jgi:hypothetical protein
MNLSYTFSQGVEKIFQENLPASATMSSSELIVKMKEFEKFNFDETNRSFILTDQRGLTRTEWFFSRDVVTASYHGTYSTAQKYLYFHLMYEGIDWISSNSVELSEEMEESIAACFGLPREIRIHTSETVVILPKAPWITSYYTWSCDPGGLYTKNCVYLKGEAQAIFDTFVKEAKANGIS